MKKPKNKKNTQSLIVVLFLVIDHNRSYVYVDKRELIASSVEEIMYISEGEHVPAENTISGINLYFGLILKHSNLLENL